MSKHKKISQREAMRLRKRVNELERCERIWKSNDGFVDRRHIAGPFTISDNITLPLRTAERLGFNVVASINMDGCINYHAVKKPTT